MLEQTLQQLIELIAEVTGNEIETIQPNSDLAEDLGIVLDEDFERLIYVINHQFAIKLDADQTSNVVSSVIDLANLIDEELELG